MFESSCFNTLALLNKALFYTVMYTFSVMIRISEAIIYKEIFIQFTVYRLKVQDVMAYQTA